MVFVGDINVVFKLKKIHQSEPNKIGSVQSSFMLKLLPGEEIKFETDSCIVMNGKSFTETTTIFTNFRFVFEEIHVKYLRAFALIYRFLGY